MAEELKRIKKTYGENFMKMCRSLFPTLLEKEGRLEEILSASFAGNSKTLYEDIVNEGLEDEFKDYIYSKVDVEDSEKKIIIEKTPYELLQDAGYELTECRTEEEIQKFKKWYKPGEELCTFGGGRLNRCVVFWAVKKDAQNIKREDFTKPKREDEYGTSVMGIQFNRQGMCTVSIKNRYNHTVNNPDATYGNDLDRIIPGLTRSFSTLLKKEYGLELNSTNVEKFEIPGYIMANDGKYYKYNMEIEGIYYCPGNVIIKNGEPHKLENPESQILMDYFILDTKNKTIKLYDPNIKDSFIEAFQDLSEAKIQIEKSKEKGNGIRVITIHQNPKDPIIIEIDKNNQIIGYKNQELEQVGNYFLYNNQVLNQLKLPKLKKAGNGFLNMNQGLIQLELPNLEEVGWWFLSENQVLNQLKLPKLKRAGDGFLNINQSLTQLELLNLEEVGGGFLSENQGLTQLKLPKLKRAGWEFLSSNQGLTQLELPNLKRVGPYFLYANRGLTQLELPNLKETGDYFLYANQGLKQLELPNLEETGDYFLYSNQGLMQLESPNLKQVGHYFLYYNQDLKQLELQNLEKAERGFLYYNRCLNKLELPKMPKLRAEFSWIIDMNKKIINSQSIAKLDKDNGLTTSEISMARRAIEKLYRWIIQGRR